MTTAVITAQDMFTQQQLPSQERCLQDNSYHHSTGDVHMTTAAITAQHSRSILKQI